VKESERANFYIPASVADLFADFEVCPTEPLRKGAVQHALGKSASHRYDLKKD
jgi:hypothetical protein